MRLEEHPFIRCVSEERKSIVVGAIDVLELESGDMIFDEQSEPDALFLILKGSVEFTKLKSDGNHQPVSESGEGAFFGEVGVFTGERRALGAFAKGVCILGKVPESTVKLIIEDAEPVRKILESVIQHLNSTTSHYMNEVMRTEKLALVGTMVSSILHDFKNPFAIISMGAQLILRNSRDNEKVTKLCNNIESQIRSMVHMANDLAAFSRGENEIEISNVSLKALFKYFNELNAPVIADGKVTLELEHNHISMEGDQIKLLRVLQNLVGNAIDAILSKKENGHVSVIAKLTGDNVILTVSDDGPGIPEEIQDTLFEPFVTQGKTGGTGLGTAIAKSIITSHNGHIDFETGAQGTTFTVCLPKTH
ncbi:MAG: ATP-binding protein [Verrucomicrobiota bacterium]